jgi:hypothetical protein
MARAKEAHARLFAPDRDSAPDGVDRAVARRKTRGCRGTAARLAIGGAGHGHQEKTRGDEIAHREEALRAQVAGEESYRQEIVRAQDDKAREAERKKGSYSQARADENRGAKAENHEVSRGAA